MFSERVMRLLQNSNHAEGEKNMVVLNKFCIGSLETAGETLASMRV
jgi:hypothetical protein